MTSLVAVPLSTAKLIFNYGWQEVYGVTQEGEQFTTSLIAEEDDLKQFDVLAIEGEHIETYEDTLCNHRSTLKGITYTTRYCLNCERTIKHVKQEECEHTEFEDNLTGVTCLDCGLEFEEVSENE